MKYIIMLFMIVSLSYSDAKLIQRSNVLGTKVDTICVDGYKFLVVKDKTGISLVQVYEARGGSKPARPVECYQ